MAIKKIEYSAKKRGDLWTATDANEVKDVVNSNSDTLTEHDGVIKNINDTLELTNRQLKANTQNIKNLLADSTKSVWLKQSEYDALVSEGNVNADVEYNIYEEE